MKGKQSTKMGKEKKKKGRIENWAENQNQMKQNQD